MQVLNIYLTLVLKTSKHLWVFDERWLTQEVPSCVYRMSKLVKYQVENEMDRETKRGLVYVHVYM